VNTIEMVPSASMVASAVRLDDQHRASLVLVRSFWLDEGSAVAEVAEGQHIDLVEYGTWRISHTDTGPATVSLEFPDGTDLEPEVIEALLAALVSGQGQQWGIEAMEAA
jgi:hypothetical protein